MDDRTRPQRRLSKAAALLAVAGIGMAPGRAAPNPVIREFVTKPFAPYAYEGANRQAAGPLVDLLHATCSQAGWVCTVKVLPLRRAVGMAERGEVDGVFPIVDSPERRREFQLTPPVVQARYVLVAPSGSGPAWPVVHAPAIPGLQGRTIAAYGPSDATLTVQRLSARALDVRMPVEVDHDTVLRKLSAGRYGPDGLALVNEEVAKSLRTEPGAARWRSLGTVKEFGYAYAFSGRVGAADVRCFAEAVKALCRSGAVAAIFRPYGLAAANCEHASPPHLSKD